MELAITIFLFALGAICIIKGGDWFVDSASWIAEVTGIPKFIVGATIVSLATTLPELIVS
ncbi:MAG: sodium:calcium antiporter, partial [Pseudoflavonifractor sp.]